MNEPPIDPDNFFKTACKFEAALILVAIVLGWIAAINPFEFIIFDEQAIINGITGTLPLCLIFIALNQLQLKSLQKIRRVLHQTLGPSLYKHHWTDLFVLAAIARNFVSRRYSAMDRKRLGNDGWIISQQRHLWTGSCSNRFILCHGNCRKHLSRLISGLR